MQKNFVYFLPNTYIEKALDEMSEKDLLGVPVVDEDMRPVGYMSERECLKGCACATITPRRLMWEITWVKQL